MFSTLATDCGVIWEATICDNNREAGTNLDHFDDAAEGEGEGEEDQDDGDHDEEVGADALTLFACWK